MLTAALAPHGGGGSDDSAHGGDMSGCRSRLHWWRPLTTALRGVGGQERTKPYGDRRPPVRRWTRRADLFDEEDVGGGRPGALPVLPVPQEALPRPGVRTLTSPLVCVPKLEEDAVAVCVWEVEACFSEPAILYEFRGEWEEIGRDNAVLLLGSGTPRFLMAGEDITWCWRVFGPFCGRTENPKPRPEVCLQRDCLLLQCLSR